MDEAGARRCGDPAEHSPALLCEVGAMSLEPDPAAIRRAPRDHPPSGGSRSVAPALRPAATHRQSGSAARAASDRSSGSAALRVSNLPSASPAGRAGPEQGVPPPSESPHGRGGRRRHTPSPSHHGPRLDLGGLAVSRGKELRPFLVISESRRPGQLRPVVRVTARQGLGRPQRGTD